MLRVPAVNLLSFCATGYGWIRSFTPNTPALSLLHSFIEPKKRQTGYCFSYGHAVRVCAAAITPLKRGSERLFQQQITKEKQRLQKQRDAIKKNIASLERELKSIDAEIKAIQAYETARGVKVKVAGGRRRRKTSRRAEIVAIVKASKTGIGRAGIIDQLGIKGDKSAEQSVSNALSAMKKSGELKHEDGLYSS